MDQNGVRKEDEKKMDLEHLSRDVRLEKQFVRFCQLRCPYFLRSHGIATFCQIAVKLCLKVP